MEKENDLASYEGHGRTGTAERQTQMRTGTRPCQGEPAAAGRELQCSPAPSPEIPLAPQGPRLAAGVGPPSQLCGVGATPPPGPAIHSVTLSTPPTCGERRGITWDSSSRCHPLEFSPSSRAHPREPLLRAAPGASRTALGCRGEGS